MSSKDFLKSVEGKLLNNKRKAQPDMRMDALLGCTSKRIRREIKCEIVRENKKVHVSRANEDVTDNLRKVVGKNNEMNSLSMDSSYNYDKGLVDDPKQVELFLRQVESQTQPQTNNNKEIEPTNSLTGPYSFLEKSICLSELSGNSEIDLNLGVLCANFDSLYEDLLESLVSVERWMNMATTPQNTDLIEKDHGVLSQDQHEIMMDLSKVLGI